MSGPGRAKLHVVAEAREPTASERLTDIVPELIAAEVLVAQLRASMKIAGQDLARERRVAFVREEHIRREFGPGRNEGGQ